MDNLEKNQDSDFMRERIKERPVNKKKLLRRTVITASMAVIFGLIACFTFLVLEPVFSNWLYPEEDAQIVELPSDVADEIMPEDMLTDNDIIPDEEDLEEILSGVELDLDDYKGIYESLAELAAETEKSLVTVTSVTSDIDWFNNTYQNKGTATGVIIADNGKELLILTEASVLKSAEKISVTFVDGMHSEAEVKQSDNNTGLAIAAIPLGKIPEATRKNIAYANLGNSLIGNLEGAPVIAVGRPLGSSDSVCYGMITSAGTQISLVDANYRLLTTDIYGSAQCTGVLINLQGQIIGILDSSYNHSDMKNLVSAIGISELKSVIVKLSNGAPIAYLGVHGTDVTEEISAQLGMPKGAYVTEIEMDSPAMNYGIQSGDVITNYGLMPITCFSDLTKMVLDTEPGTTVTITVQRQRAGEYQPMEISVELR